MSTIQERLRKYAKDEYEFEGPPEMSPSLGYADAHEAADRIDELEAKVRLQTLALENIAKGAGPYSRDPLQHADNCIEAMNHSANYALGRTDVKPEWAEDAEEGTA